MPGAPLLISQDTYQGVTGQGVPSGGAGVSPSGLSWSFFVWLLILGVLVPVAVLGGLRAGGYQFVYKRR